MENHKWREITEQIIGAAYKVHNTLSGFLEKVYQKSLVIELQTLGFSVDHDEVVGIYVADIIVHKMFTYSCDGTGGHSKTIELYENDTLIASGVWNGYECDWHDITIHNITSASYVTLLKGHNYNYTIYTGSYPQIIHAHSKEVTGGTITCTEFVDANGKVYYDWIPAIRLD